MFSLVQFKDDKWTILPTKKISGNSAVGHSGNYQGSRYSLEILYRNDDINILKQLKWNLMNGIPHICGNKECIEETEETSEDMKSIESATFGPTDILNINEEMTHDSENVTIDKSYIERPNLLITQNDNIEIQMNLLDEPCRTDILKTKDEMKRKIIIIDNTCIKRANTPTSENALVDPTENEVVWGADLGAVDATFGPTDILNINEEMTHDSENVTIDKSYIERPNLLITQNDNIEIQMNLLDEPCRTDILKTKDEMKRKLIIIDNTCIKRANTSTSENALVDPTENEVVWGADLGAVDDFMEDDALGQFHIENHYFNELGEEVEINESSGAIRNKRTVKKHNCYYCCTLQSQISRHLINKHKMEDLVKKALQYTKGSAQRKMVMENIRKLGDATPNNSKTITVGKIKKADMVPCPHCRGFYSKFNLRNHVRKYCKFATNRKRNNIGIGRVLMAYIHPLANQMLRDIIFPRIRQDDYFKTVTKDESLVLLGNRLCQKYLTTSKHHDKMIAQHLRLVARIFLIMQRNNSSLKEVRDIINPIHWDEFVVAVREMAGSRENGTYKIPSVVHYACDIMRHLAILLKCEAIKRNDDKWQSLVEKFQYLLSGNQNADLTKAATETRASQQRKKSEIVPTTEEINNLLTKINNEITQYYTILQRGYNYEAWKTLNELVLIFIMVFNRKRPGDVERIEIAEYEKLCVVEGEYAEKLNEANKVLANSLGRCVTRGKLNQAASLLVNKDHMKVIKLLLQHRNDANISDNQYLFAESKPGRYPYLKAGKILGDFVKKNNMNTISLTATKLRYHLASSTARLDRDKQSIISKFMGHEPGVHNKCYQKALIQNDVLTMGGVLMASNGFIPELFNSYIQPVSEITNEVTPQWLDKDENESDSSEPEMHKPLNNDHTDLSPVIEQNTVHDFSEDHLSPIASSSKSKPMMDYTERCSTPLSSWSPKSSETSPRRRLPLSSKSRITWITPERHYVREKFKHKYRTNLVPKINECQDIIDNSRLRNRTPIQIQTWVRADMERKSRPRSQKRSWTTPQKIRCREYFKDYYEHKKPNKYPTVQELQNAIATVPEFKDKTAPVLRSHLQHDYEYVKHKNK